jgi:hypothetical protein
LAERGYEFHLYRVTVHPTREALFATRARIDDKAGLLRSAVFERPEVPWGRTRWAIGNTEALNDDAVYFRIWRAGTTTLPQHDPKGNVVEREVESAPNAPVLLDIKLQVAAIARAPRLAAEVDCIAHGLECLLNSSVVARERFAELHVAGMKDAREFLERLRGAHRVAALWVEVRRPNPADIKGLAKNLKDAVETVRAEKSKTQFSGERLDASQPEVEELIRMTSATGGNAGARIQETEAASGTIGISLETKLARFRTSVDFALPESIGALLSVVREKYRRLRDEE